MTSQEYRAKLKSFGLTPLRPSYDGATIYQSRDGSVFTIIDPESLTADERMDLIAVYVAQFGLSESH